MKIKEVALKKTKVDDDLNISFSFDHFNILGVVNDDVYIHGFVYLDNIDDCVVIIKSKLLHDALDVWIENKRSICDSYKHFCGFMGSISATNYVEVEKERIADKEKTKTIDLDKGDWSWENTSKLVRTFVIKSIDSYADMEHG